jgi:putative ABC transport system permease protein
MGVLRFKLIRDIWNNKSRTLQVMLIIGIGSAAIGMIIGTRNLVINGMQDIWRRADPAMMNLFINPPVDDAELIELGQVKGVTQIEGFNTITIDWRLSPNEEWRQGTLNAREDYKTQKMNRLELVKGNWPHSRELANGQDYLAYGIPSSGVVYIRTDEREGPVKIGTGEIYDQLTQPATFGGTAQFYVDQEFFEYLVGNKDYSRAIVNADHWDEDYVTEIADRLDAKVKSMDKEVAFRLITDPNKHFFQDSMDGIFFLMGVLGSLALILGLLLVYNTINSIISSQTDQIGIMKAIGGRTRQVVSLYFRMVLIYGLLALLISIPLGIMGAWAMSNWLVNSFGADLGQFTLDRTALAVQVAICLLAPLLASLVPIFQAARITVREAISTYGLSTRVGTLEKIMNKVRVFSRVMIVTISNTFRHKGRVFLLEIALVLSGVVFMMVVGIRDSASYMFKDLLFTILNANITMVFKNPERIEHIKELTLQYPGIKSVEMWAFGSGNIRPCEQPASDDDEAVQMWGVPLPTQAYGYQLRGGRWLTPQDDYAIVLNAKQVDDIGKNGVKVGDCVTVKFSAKKERNYTVVGLVFDPLLTTTALVERDHLLQDLGEVGKTTAVWIQTERTGLQAEQAIAKGLRGYYEANNVQVSSQRGIFGIGGESTSETGDTFVNQFNFLLVLLGVMAVVIGIVGSIALSGALALSVMERTREIGVMRATGASSFTIFRLFIGEGLILGWLSWLIAAIISIPFANMMTSAVGNAFQFEMIYKYQPTGAIAWLVIITILSVLASVLPARGATKVSVRESLAYS